MFIKFIIIIIWYIFNIIIIGVLSINTLNNNLNLNSNLGTHPLLFQTLDLIKIFGRLSEPSLIGNVMPSSLDRLGKKTTIKKLKWRSLFKNKSEELDLDKFSKRLYECNFNWPTDYIANKTAPFLIPLKDRHKFRIKCKCLPVNYEIYDDIMAKIAQRDNIPKKGITINILNQHLNKESIDKESIESTFQALSGDEDKLTVEHIIAYINYRSPLIEMVNWNCFISSLPVGPQDNVS